MIGKFAWAAEHYIRDQKSEELYEFIAISLNMVK